MTFCLDSIIIKPDNNKEIKNSVILLHGYGGDGKDISMLSLNWKRHLPNTIFICPNGHEKCPINPSGFQWFDLTQDDPKYIDDLIRKWEEGFDVVLAKRIGREEGLFRRIIFGTFFKLQKYFSDIDIPENVGHFSLLNRESIKNINNLLKNLNK